MKASTHSMKTLHIFKSIAILCLALLLACNSQDTAQKADMNAGEADFIVPSNDNTLWCYWYWIGDDISKDGITKDLEAMKAAGIGGALIGNINPDEIDGNVPMLSDAWWEHMVHAINEGKRIGVDIGVFNCPGWSQSGGPWVKADMAMRYLTYEETKITGGAKVKVNLAKPTLEFQDTYVLAFPSIAAESNTLSTKNASLTIQPTVANSKQLMDGDKNTLVGFSKAVKKYKLKINGTKEITAKSIKITPSTNAFTVQCKVFATIQGTETLVKTFVIDRSNLNPNVGPDKYAPIVMALPNVTSNRFTIEFVAMAGTFNPKAKRQNYHLAEIEISEAAGLEKFPEKTLGKMHPTPFPAWDSYLWEPQEAIDNAELKITKNAVVDISDKLDKNGTIVWNAPEGEWTIQRYGMTPTGTKNSPAAPQGKGYEIDKMDEELIRFHFDQFVGKLLAKVPEANRDAFKYVIGDSYEMGSQNWSDNFQKEFKTTYGYDPKPFLPTYSGRIVESVEASERFLWDMRRFVADQVAYQYVGGLRKISNEHNLQLWLENYGHWGFPSEFLKYGGQSDLVSGEFWNEGTLGDIECKSAASAAHIYGKNRVSAEAFTAAHRTYVRHPALLKKRGDWSFTGSINHFVLHLYVHQPDDNRVPGVNAWFSTEFNRHNTWFQKSKTYFDYIRRCQHLLQQGNYAADVCYFIGEDAPIMTGVRNPELPNGYSYDYINAEVILNRLSVKDGKFVLPDGMTYNLMVLPPFNSMRPELLEKIESLVAQGGKIFGQAPEKSPSLQNFPESDTRVKALAANMWGAGTEKIKPYQKGFVADGLELQDALNQLGIAKDVQFDTDVPVLWTHRTIPNMEIYFLTNQSDQEISFTPSFRVQGKKPQLWDAITGEVRALHEFKEHNGNMEVPITMKPLQSWFVVFSNDTPANMHAGYATNFPKSTQIKTLDKAWKVDFHNKNIGPKEAVNFSKLTDWSSHENEKIKYYSGTATYTSSFEYSVKNDTDAIFIDLGKVGVMATVAINGKEVGTTWIAPYKLNISDALKEGNNTIKIEVVNVFRNRITGDKQLPKEARSTWLLVDSVTPQEELVPSGLLGPVSLQKITK